MNFCEPVSHFLNGCIDPSVCVVDALMDFCESVSHFLDGCIDAPVCVVDPLMDFCEPFLHFLDGCIDALVCVIDALMDFRKPVSHFLNGCIDPSVCVVDALMDFCKSLLHFLNNRIDPLVCIVNSLIGGIDAPMDFTEADLDLIDQPTVHLQDLPELTLDLHERLVDLPQRLRVLLLQRVHTFRQFSHIAIPPPGTFALCVRVFYLIAYIFTYGVTMRVHLLLLGDIIGRPGRSIVREMLPRIREERPVDLVVANIENAAHGFGITPAIADELFSYGIDVMTSGNHIYDKKEIIPYLSTTDRLLRPANYPNEAPGCGWVIVPLPQGSRIAVINLQGRVLMPWIHCPFEWVDTHLAAIRAETPLIIVDFHAEATSEKTAMGWYLNGRVTAVFGTHTHIATADAMILPGGHTAYVTDVGMNGPYQSVIGMDIAISIRRLRTMFPKFLEVAKGPRQFAALYVVADTTTGHAVHVEHILYREPPDPEVPRFS